MVVNNIVFISCNNLLLYFVTGYNFVVSMYVCMHSCLNTRKGIVFRNQFMLSMDYLEQFMLSIILRDQYVLFVVTWTSLYCPLFSSTSLCCLRCFWISVVVYDLPRPGSVVLFIIILCTFLLFVFSRQNYIVYGFPVQA